MRLLCKDGSFLYLERNVELSRYPDHVVPGTWFRPWFHVLVTVAPVEIRSCAVR
jgi:hypothetical protein